MLDIKIFKTNVEYQFDWCWTSHSLCRKVGTWNIHPQTIQ